MNEGKGFTLIELLIVIAIIGILAFVVFIALNPLGRFQDARNSDREQNIESIGKSAVLQYNVDNGGIWPTGIPQLTSTTYANGFNGIIPQCTPTGVTSSNHGVGQGCDWADDPTIASQLAPKYLSSIPVDTNYASSDYLYHYYLALTPDNTHIVVMSYGFEPGASSNNGATPYSTTNPYYVTF